MRSLALTAALLVVVAALHAQTSPTGSTGLPTCAEDLRGARAKLEADYAGFRLEIVGARRAAFDRIYAALQRRAQANTGDCFGVLNDLTEWFDDPHLFIYQTTRLDSAESARRARAVRMLPLTEDQARAYLSAAPRLDPIEGIWDDGRLRVAVVPDSGAHPDRFVAVVLRPDTSIWAPGAVRGTFTLRTDGSYDAQLYGANYVRWHRHAHVHKDVLLRLDPGMWGKAFPVPPADGGLVAAGDPHQPTLIVRQGAVVVSIPSHDPSLKPLLDSLIAANAERLQSSDLLIVDLRGNEGGASFMSSSLDPYIASREPRPAPAVHRQAVVLSSPDQIAYARRLVGGDTTAPIRALMADLEAHVGQFVPFTLWSEAPDTAPKIADHPRRVGVLMDRGTVSASEVLVEEALRSTRTTVFGLPTAGALDYEQVNIVAILPTEHRWFLGYPTITRDIHLPKGGMRGKGLQPDVVVRWDTVPDPIGYVIDALRH